MLRWKVVFFLSRILANHEWIQNKNKNKNSKRKTNHNKNIRKNFIFALMELSSIQGQLCPKVGREETFWFSVTTVPQSVPWPPECVSGSWEEKAASLVTQNISTQDKSPPGGSTAEQRVLCLSEGWWRRLRFQDPAERGSSSWVRWGWREGGGQEVEWVVSGGDRLAEMPDRGCEIPLANLQT